MAGGGAAGVARVAAGPRAISCRPAGPPDATLQAE